MTGFGVSPAQLQATQSYVADVAGELHTALTRADDRVEALLEGWTGTAADGFRDGWQEWQAGAVKVLDALGRIGVALGDNGRAYTAADLTARTGITTAGVRLD